MEKPFMRFLGPSLLIPGKEPDLLKKRAKGYFVFYFLVPEVAFVYGV
jgi:hypothetical protein